MGDIVQFYDKTINITQEITATKSWLKTITNNNWFQEIKAEILKNEKSSKNVLRQCKFRKFKTLKYKSKVPSHTNSQEDDIDSIH